MHGQAQACPPGTRGAPARPAPEIIIIIGKHYNGSLYGSRGLTPSGS